MLRPLDLASLPYPGRRQPIFAPHGVVATSQPLAEQPCSALPMFMG